MSRQELLQIAKPILFNTEMVRAILDGRKTQTRIIASDTANMVFECSGVCPSSKYKKGDILYVRETFNDEGWDDQSPLIYRADFSDDESKLYWWKPSVRMPKKYARIFLKVTNVRVERLQDIGNNDAIQDGFDYEDTEIGFPNGWAGATQTPRFSFAIDWNDEAKDGFRWEDNPYVFVYEFDMVEA